MNTVSDSARRMTEVAGQLLQTLSPSQLAMAQLPMPSDDERQRWFYTPTDHGGLTLHSLAPHQQRLVMQLIASGTSLAGYVSVSTIMGLENVLDQLEGFGSLWTFERGRDPLRYFVRVFGHPGDEAWGWRIGGHHVSLHFTVVNGETISATPCFLGADPASSPLLGGHQLRPLGACEDIARDLLSSLTEEQRDRAVVSQVPPTDLVTANRSVISDGDRALRLVKVWRNEFTGELRELVENVQDREESRIGYTESHARATAFTTAPKGLCVTDMSRDQQSTLRSLMTTFIGRVDEDIAEREMTRLENHFASLHFAWAGDTAVGKPHYYRVQGHRILAEYDNTTRDGNHVHTVWRDPVGDFGRDVLAAHRREHHSGG